MFSALRSNLNSISECSPIKALVGKVILRLNTPVAEFVPVIAMKNGVKF